jgi:hypothetical protein
MRSGNWRGVTLALGLSCVLAVPSLGRADYFHTIPDLVPAVDLNTGGPYYAPPIPYGHYTGKDIPGYLTKRLSGLLHGLGNVCGLCGGAGCNACGGSGRGCGLCGGKGCDACGGTGACGKGGACGNGLCGGLGRGGLFHKGGGCFGKADGGCFGHASTVSASAQAPTTIVVSPPSPSPQCGAPGCGLLGRHKHRGCGLCGGKGCGGCGVSNLCGACGGKGCGLCGGRGIGCGACGGRGCGLCGRGTGCGLCGGIGCAACARARGLVNHLLGRDQIKWFTGPGGPVPLTPGYTPYVVTTRSPRDFFAFPPMTP